MYTKKIWRVRCYYACTEQSARTDVSLSLFGGARCSLLRAIYMYIELSSGIDASPALGCLHGLSSTDYGKGQRVQMSRRRFHVISVHAHIYGVIYSILIGQSVAQLARIIIIILLCRRRHILPTTRIKCGTLYATPAGPRGITERIRRKLYVYFENTTSTFRISRIYRDSCTRRKPRLKR